LTPTKWQHVQQLVHAALDLPQSERAAFLETVCGSNTELRREIGTLIVSYEQAGNFLEDAVEASACDAFRPGTLRNGDRLGPYEITSVIGYGGMGAVYCALRVDDQFRQQVAIKVLSGGWGPTPELVSRFRAERQILATLNHPNVARLLDGGMTLTGLPYLVMEYIEGASIDRFAKDRNLSIRGRLELFRQVCSAVQYAHRNLIVHRDIKPANVMVTDDGTPKLLDFGIAKLLNPESLGQTVALTRPADRLMTPEYASPEQIRGEPVNTASDIYALGVLLYELLAGKRPFETANLTFSNLEHLVCETTPERPSRVRPQNGKAAEPVPADLDNVVLKAMHRDPNCRYASAAELSDDVRRWLEGFPVNARPDTWDYRVRKFVSRHKIATAAAALFAVTTTALSIGLAVQATRAKREAETSNQVAAFLANLFEFSRPDETQGRGSGAREVLDIGAKRAVTELIGQPVVEARLLQILGTTYRELGIFDQADTLLTRAYTIRSKMLGPNSPETAETLQTIAEIASDKGEVQRAKQDYEKVLRIYERTYGLKNEKTVEVITDIGELRWSLGDFPGAKDLYLQAIALCKQFKSASDWQVLNAKNDLQVVLADQGDYAAAASLAREVLETEVKTMGPNNPNVSLTLNNLGYALAQTAQYREAEAIFKRALLLREKVDGPEHPAIALSLSNLGWLARELGHYSEAQDLGQKAVAMAAKLAGPRSLDTAACQGQLGLTMLAEGKLPQARQLLKAALETRLALGNGNNPELADNYDRMGLLELRTGNLAAAQDDISRGLKIRKRFYGDENDNVAISLNHIGDVLAAQGENTLAEQDYRAAIQIARAKFKTAHTITADGLFGLATVLLAEGRADQAKSAVTEALEMRRQLLPPGHPDIAAAAAELAKCRDAGQRS